MVRKQKKEKNKKWCKRRFGAFQNFVATYAVMNVVTGIRTGLDSIISGFPFAMRPLAIFAIQVCSENCHLLHKSPEF